MYTEPDDDGDGLIEVVVTMLSGLAEFVHDASATEHDTTFKRVFGKFNEWEVVIWEKSLCRRQYHSFISSQASF